MQVWSECERDSKDKCSTLIFTDNSSSWLLKAVPNKRCHQKGRAKTQRAGCRAPRSLSTPTESAAEQKPGYFKTSTTPRNFSWDCLRTSARQIGNSSHHKYSQMTQVSPGREPEERTLGSHALLGQDILTRGHHWHWVFFLQAEKQRQSIYRILISEIIQAPRSKCWNHTQHSTIGMPDKTRSYNNLNYCDTFKSTSVSYKPSMLFPPLAPFFSKQEPKLPIPSILSHKQLVSG